MVHKRRPSKGSQTISQPQTQILPMDCDENVLQSVTHNIDAIHQDLSLLDLESFLLPSTHLPVLDVDAAQLKNVQQSHLLPLFNNARTVSRSSKLHLPRSIAPQSTIPSVQHYVLIPNAALNRSNHLAPCSSVLNIPERSDGRYTIAMEAKREATVIKKVNKLIKRGLWSSNRLPKVMEPPQPLCHWDHLLEEACWLAEDFKQERLWKKAIAKKLADAAMMFCMISSELARRNEEELEGLRQRGAAMVAKMVQDWWAEVSETASSLSVLSEHRQWCAALQRNRVFLTHLTDTGANWMFEAVSRSSRSTAPPPFSAPKQTLPLAPTMVLEEEDVDELWLPPKSSTSSTANGSVESLTDAGVQFNPDAFSWGLQSHMTTAAPMSLDSSPSEGDSEDQVSMSSDSSGASTLATDQEDVFGLISNAGLPLNEALEPYSSNGWPLQPPITEPEDWDEDSPYQSIVNVLRHEATLPLRQLLPPGYHPITSSALEMNGSDDTSIRRRQPQRRPNRLALVNGCSPHDETVDAVADGLVDDDVDREDEVRSETSAEAEPMEVDGYPSDSEVSAASSMTTAAHFWNSVTDATATSLVPSASPGELARRARGLSQWRTQVPSRRALHSRLPAFGPTCRVPFLPTSSLRSGLSWLSVTYSHQVPTCLVTYSIPSADAELCLAVHIGQLAVSGASGNGVGDWGPHLIVCPGVLLSAWRARLAAVCPGLRVHCVLAHSRGGTGRRLKLGIARRNVHICLTSYAALKLRPSRFEGVQWHLVILDQVQHLINPSLFQSVNANISHMSTNEQINAGSASELSSGNTNPAHPSESSVFPDLVCLLLRRLLPSARQRVCIFTDLYEPCAAHLKTLLSLLLQSSNTDDGSGFVEELVRQVSLIKPEQGVVTTRDDVMRALEPFLYRFIDDEEDEEDEDESATRSSNRIEDLVRIDVVSDHLTDQQRALHDHILTDKTCERAVRSGHLTDLLNCLSAGARLCCHPWLLSYFDEPAQWLLQDREPAFSPPLVTVPGLHFDGPASLLELRRTDDEISPHLLHLPSALQAPAHVRSRLMQLLPDAEQLKHLLITPCPSKRASETSGTPLLAIKRLRRGQVAPVGSIEEQEEPFITRDTLRTVVLETANASYATNETIAEPTDIHLSSSIEMESPLPTNADLVEQGSSAVPNPILSAEGKSRLHQLLWQYQRTRLELEGHTDWCSVATMDRIHALSREPSLLPLGVNVFPALPFIDSSFELCRVVQDRFEHLPLLSSPFSLLCTRDKAVGLPSQLATTSTCPLKSVDVETVINQFYPLLSSTRWLCPQTIPHLLPQFLTSSGKIQRLRSLLLDLVRSPSPSSRPSETQLSQNHTNRTPPRRPRVIFLLCHRTALLDLLTAWLSIDPYLANLALLRAPIDQLDADGGDDSMLLLDDSHAKSGRSLWVDQVNAWPSGIQGPLLVLLHARSPSLSAAGLRMGPDTRLVICDADWRKDVVSTVKSKLRCWSINGLVDVPPRTRCNESLPPLLQAYRLVTEWDSGDSVEARLVKSTAIQLLPDSVFMTASPPAASAAFASTGRSRSAVALPLIPPSSRVQPNVVRQLVSCLRRRALWRSKTALPPLQSQVSSNTSMPPLDSDGVEEEEEATTTQDDESDNASLFHKRAPIQKDLLIQCFDLHEPPRDVQAWCSSLAEPAAIAVEMHSDCLDPQLESVVSLPLSEDSLLRAAGLNSYDDVLFQKSPIRLVPPEVLEMWELDQASWRETMEAVVEFTMGQGEPLFYLPPGESTGNMVEQEIADENNLPIEDAFKLPLWVPSFFEDPEFCKGPLPAPFDRLDLTRAIASNVAKTRDNSSSATTWGYASDAMAEAELPPFSSTVSPLFDSTNTTATRYPGSVGSSPAVNASASTKSAVETASPAMSYALKRTAVATLSARNSVNVSGGRAAAPPSKKRRLTGAAAMAARRAASNKAAAAAAATANSSAVTDGSAGRLIRLERDEKPLVTSSTQDRADLPSNSASGNGTTTGSATVAAASTPTITPATVSTTLTMTLPSNQKISIPRPFYSRDLRTISGGAVSTTNQGGGVGSSGVSASGTSFSPSARIRRVTSSTQITSSARLSGSGGGSSPAVPNGVTGVFPALNNPHLLAKYAITSTGKPTASQRQGPHPSGMVSFKYGSSSTVSHPQSSVSDIKPLEWSPLEEAALLMCTTKLQDIPLTVSNSCLSHSPHHQATATSTYTRMPNFRLVEFFLNNFHATRAYRSCRQCLLVYYRILSALVTSSAADLMLPPTDEDGPISTYPHHLQHQQHQQHGSSTSVGRKVKNKLKSGLSTPIIPPSASPLDQNTSISAVSNDFTVASGGATASPANKLRGYQYFLYLESHLSTLATASTQTPGGSATVNTAAPITGLVDNQIISILRKCVREATPKSGSSSSHHHLHHHHHPGVSAMVSSHHPQTQAQQRVGGPATAATMLMRNAAAAAAAAAAASASQVPPQLPSGATVIQKNPSHIAALQEHNISPDTLITPAMVIKSKEEREARQRTEAVAAAAAAAAAVASSSASPTPSSVPSVAVVATSTPSVPVSGSAAVVVGSANTPGVLPTARVHHHSHQQHPTIVTISGTGSPSGGSNLQRSASILPFSTAASVNYHGGSGASPTVFRYTTPGSMGAAARQVSSTTATPTGILRRVGSSVVGGSPQSVFAVTPATASGTAHVISNVNPSRGLSVQSHYSNTGGTTMVRRGVTLTPAGVSQAGGVANASGCGAGGVTVLATTSSARPASVIYHHHQHQTSGATPAGITLLSAGAQALPQIIRPRQQFRPGTALPTQRFVRTLSVTPAGSGIAASGAGQATTTTPIHRTRDGLFTSPIQQHTQQRGGGGVVVPESQILLSRIHPVSSGSRRPATANIAASGGARQQQSGQPTPPPQSSSASSNQPQ